MDSKPGKTLNESLEASSAYYSAIGSGSNLDNMATLGTNDSLTSQVEHGEGVDQNSKLKSSNSTLANITMMGMTTLNETSRAVHFKYNTDETEQNLSLKERSVDDKKTLASSSEPQDQTSVLVHNAKLLHIPDDSSTSHMTSTDSRGLSSLGILSASVVGMNPNPKDRDTPLARNQASLSQPQTTEAAVDGSTSFALSVSLNESAASAQINDSVLEAIKTRVPLSGPKLISIPQHHTPDPSAATATRHPIGCEKFVDTSAAIATDSTLGQLSKLSDLSQARWSGADRLGVSSLTATSSGDTAHCADADKLASSCLLNQTDLQALSGIQAGHDSTSTFVTMRTPSSAARSQELQLPSRHTPHNPRLTPNSQSQLQSTRQAHILHVSSDSPFQNFPAQDDVSLLDNTQMDADIAAEMIREVERMATDDYPPESYEATQSPTRPVALKQTPSRTPNHGHNIPSITTPTPGNLSLHQSASGLRRTASSGAIGSGFQRMEGLVFGQGSANNLPQVQNDVKHHMGPRVRTNAVLVDGMDSLDCTVEREGIAADAAEEASANAFEHAYRYLTAHGEDALAQALAQARQKVLSGQDQLDDLQGYDDDATISRLDALKQSAGEVLNKMFQFDDHSTRFFLVMLALSALATYRVWFVRQRIRQRNSSPPVAVPPGFLAKTFTSVASFAGKHIPGMSQLGASLAPVVTKAASLWPGAMDLDPRFALLPPTVALFSLGALALKFLNWSKIAPTSLWAKRNLSKSWSGTESLDNALGQTLLPLPCDSRSDAGFVSHENGAQTSATAPQVDLQHTQRTSFAYPDDETKSIARSVKSVARSYARSQLYGQYHPTRLQYDAATGQHMMHVTVAVPHTAVCCQCKQSDIRSVPGGSTWLASESGSRSRRFDWRDSLAKAKADADAREQERRKKPSTLGVLLVFLYTLFLHT